MKIYFFLSQSRDTFRFTRSFYYRRLEKDQNSTQHNIYSSYVVFLYKPTQLKHPILLMCQHENYCQNTPVFLEITPGKYAPIIATQETPSTPIFTKMAEILNLSTKIKGNKTAVSLMGEECDMMLQIQVRYDGAYDDR